MRTLGIDIGSRTIKTVLVENGEVVHEQVLDTSHRPMDICREMVSPLTCDSMVATGYGRKLFHENWPESGLMTEIKAIAIGARHLFPECRTIVDIGGQDTKAVSLDPEGKLHKFVMNDRCAAGTGRFLEVIAAALSFDYKGFVEAATHAKRAENLSSMCAVFAETEVVSLVARGASRGEIALGLHRAIANRTAALARGIPLEEEIVFAGGGARNHCLKRILEDALGCDVTIPRNPQTVAALGSALQGARFV